MRNYLLLLSCLIVTFSLQAATWLQDSTPTPTPPGLFPSILQEFVDRFSRHIAAYGILSAIGLLLITILIYGLIPQNGFLYNWLKRARSWLAQRIHPGTNHTRNYLKWFSRRHANPKFGPQDLGGQYADTPRARLEKIYLPVEVEFESDQAEISIEASGKRSGASSKEAASPFEEGRPGKSFTLFEALQTSKVLAIIGKAGSGKSTLLQWMGLACAHSCLGQRFEGQEILIKALGKPLFPIFVSLERFDAFCQNPQRDPSAAALLDFILEDYTKPHQPLQSSSPQPLPPPEFFVNKLKKGCLLLLDGMDEVSQMRRAAVQHAIMELLEEFPHAHIHAIITARQSAQADAMSAEVLLGKVLPLDTDHRNRLIRRLYQYYDRLLADELSADLIQRLDASNENVRSLAETPLLTTIFVCICGKGNKLPDQRAEVYEKALDTLIRNLHRRDDVTLQPVETTGEDPVKQRGRLALIAFCLHEKQVGEGGLLENDLIDLLLPNFPSDSREPVAKREEIRAFLYRVAKYGGLLDERDGTFGFRTHRSFQEFLAGWHLVRNYDNQSQDEFISQHLIGGAWEEPVRLAAGYLAIYSIQEPKAFIRRIMGLGQDERQRDFAIALAGLCLADLPAERVERELREELAAKMLAALQRNPPTLPIGLRSRLGLALGGLRDPTDPKRLFDPRIHPGLTPVLVPIPAGAFNMGTSEADEKQLAELNVAVWKNEMPGHPVTITYDYEIGMYPVTNAEYRAFVLADGYDLEQNGQYWSAEGKRWLARRPLTQRNQPFFLNDPRWNGANQPVVGICWFEAEAYAAWLSVVTGQHFRLPTEAEWEKAARVLPASDTISDSTEKHFWPWGDQWDPTRCNNAEPDGRMSVTSPVGIYPHGNSPRGCADMAGNVWEWCLDFYIEDEYDQRTKTGAPVVNPRGPESGPARVVRGGSWYSDRYGARCASRYQLEPDNFSYGLGFRLVLAPPLS